MTAFLAVDNEAWCSGEGLASFDFVPLQGIDVPEDPNRYIRLEKGEVRTTVHEGVFSGEICEFVANHPKVAEGTSILVSTDNDLLTYLTTDNVNANIFGARTKGELTTMSGEKVDFMAVTGTVRDSVDLDAAKNVNIVSLK